MQPFPNKKYSVIYADPPWKYDNQGPRGGVETQYTTMLLDDIKSLPVQGISADPSILMLWATFPKMPEALSVMDAWGFTYKTLGFSWIKTNQNGLPFFGIGYYAKSNCEVCLMGTRGKAHALVKSNLISSVVLSKKKNHSSKPEEVPRRIELLFGDVPRIELFARTKRHGWDVWGDQAPDTTQTELTQTTGTVV
jgi:N6-adenosine-specific RNA methylase IME4